MPKPAKGARLGSSPQHERLILANLATSLFEHNSITTTLGKAKRLRPYAEHLVTFAKKGDLSSRRQVMKVIRDNSVVHKLFTEIAKDMEKRPGGYTRIVKIGPRPGDAAPMAVIELISTKTKEETIKKDDATKANQENDVVENVDNENVDTENVDTEKQQKPNNGQEEAKTKPEEDKAKQDETVVLKDNGEQK